MSEIRSIRLPDMFYSKDDSGERSVVPRDGAIDYVTDGQQFGIRMEGGTVDWLGTDPEEAFGEGARVLEVETEKRSR